MKQIQTCLDRHFEGQRPLKAKWQARTHPKQSSWICLFHYHHLVLVYNTENNNILMEWWEKDADRRGLESAKDYLGKRFKF